MGIALIFEGIDTLPNVSISFLASRGISFGGYEYFLKASSIISPFSGGNIPNNWDSADNIVLFKSVEKTSNSFGEVYLFDFYFVFVLYFELV